MERTTITKNIKMYVLRRTIIGLKQECGHKTSRCADMNLRFKPHFTAKMSVFRTCVLENEIVLMLFDTIHVHMLCCLSISIFKSILRGLYQYISSYWHHTLSHLTLKFTGWAIIGELTIRRQSAHFWSVGGRKHVINIYLFIYRHDMRSGLWYVLIWTSFWIFLQRSNNCKDSFNCQSVGQHRLIEKLFLMKYTDREYFQHKCGNCICECTGSRVCMAVQPAVYDRRHTAFSTEATTVDGYARDKFLNTFLKSKAKEPQCKSISSRNTV